MNDDSRLEARWRKFQGFGEEHTNAEWAKILNLSRTTLWRYFQRGLTVEEVVKLRGIKYDK